MMLKHVPKSKYMRSPTNLSRITDVPKIRHLAKNISELQHILEAEESAVTRPSMHIHTKEVILNRNNVFLFWKFSPFKLDFGKNFCINIFPNKSNFLVVTDVVIV